MDWGGGLKCTRADTLGAPDALEAHQHLLPLLCGCLTKDHITTKPIVNLGKIDRR
jgi:hypothetical protein